MREIYRGRGCARCQQAGYAGRAPIFEVMPVQSSAMREAVFSAGSPDAISEAAVKEGMTSLRQAAVDMVAQGLTSLPEALKLIVGE